MTADDLTHRLKQVGDEFIAAHDNAQDVLREASRAGMDVEAIAKASGLAEQTVRLFIGEH